MKSPTESAHAAAAAIKMMGKLIFRQLIKRASEATSIDMIEVSTPRAAIKQDLFSGDGYRGMKGPSGEEMRDPSDRGNRQSNNGRRNNPDHSGPAFRAGEL